MHKCSYLVHLFKCYIVTMSVASTCWPATAAFGRVRHQHRRTLMTSIGLLARVAHQYFVLGETQQAIAERLQINRTKIHRLLAEAKERGIVSIRINAGTSQALEMEEQLRRKYRLDICSVTPDDTGSELGLSEVIGIYAAQTVETLLRDDMTVAMAWGRTMRWLASNIEPVALRNVTVVPLLGSLSRRSSIDKYDAAAVFAQRTQAESYYLPGPIICDSRESRETILQQPSAREVIQKALNADLALMSVGGTTSSTLRSVGYMTDEEFDDVLRMKPIGNFLGYFFDRNAELIDHPVNERIVGVYPLDTLNIPKRILVSGGKNKVGIMAKLLEKGFFTGLITDQETGSSL
ncbi:MAG: sugar-binding transcriptional regulator [Mesorhizobium sp.]|nr:MAG: sugar-binding transcriptional regulator [Mesorhizobium sp.]